MELIAFLLRVFNAEAQGRRVRREILGLELRVGVGEWWVQTYIITHVERERTQKFSDCRYTWHELRSVVFVKEPAEGKVAADAVTQECT